ncbi:outer membrane assembly lipoprotein YfgL [gamma proteobacterium HTCC5015]|nr:outer membrane assembly lipoprotein YfgL [gamma proteobacterium HTCC5015]
MRYLLPVIFAVGLAACSSIKDTAEPPTPLQSIDRERALETVWKRDTGAGVEEFLVALAPAMDALRLYVVDHEGRVVALDKEKGKRQWKIDVDEAISAGVGIDDTALYLGTREGEIVALNKSDGSELWRRDLASEIMATPVSNLGTVVVKTIDGAIHGLNSTTGDELWTNRRSVPSLTLRGASEPVINGGAVYTGMDNGRFMALSLLEGRAMWETPLASPRGRNEIDRMVDVDAKPMLDEGLIFVPAFQGRAVALGQANGRILWARDISAYHGFQPSLLGRLALVDEHSQVWSLDRRSGATLWKQEKLRARRLTASVLLGDVLISADFEGYVHLLNPADGRLVGRHQYDDVGYQATPLVDGDIAYLIDREGTMRALRLEPSDSE